MISYPATTASLDHVEPGLDLILDPIDQSQVISAQIWIASGSMHESTLAGSGISHLLEHMVFKGTERFSGDQLAQQVQAAGGQWNAYTSFDRTVYYIDGPAASLELFVSALVEMAFRPTLPEDEFEKEKDVIRREIAMGLDDPQSEASQLLFRTFYQHDNRRHPVIGHRHLFDAITHEQMVTYHHARYQPENAFFVLSGGFDPAIAKKLIGEELQKGTPQPTQFPVALRTEPAQIGTRQAFQPFPVPTAQVSFSWPGPSLHHPDSEALDLALAMLGGNRTSPLYHQLREEKELVHSIGAYSWSPAEGPGFLSVYADLEPENFSELQSQIPKQIDAFLASDDLSGPLAKVKRQLATSQLKILTTASSRASDLASNWHKTRNLDYTRDVVASMQEVSEDEIRRVVKKYLVPGKLTTTGLWPEMTKLPEKPGLDASTGNKVSALETHTLPNGMKVVVQHDPTIPAVYTNTSSQLGALTEHPDTAGTNNLMGALLTKGTESRTSFQIAETLEDLGISMRVKSGNNTFGVTGFSLKDDLPILLELQADVLANATFEEDHLERERASLIASAKENMEDPVTRAFQEMRHNLWNGLGYGIPSGGTPETLAAITRQDVRERAAGFLTSQNTTIALVGDLDPDKILAEVESTFANLPDAEAPLPSSFVPTTAGEKQILMAKEQAVLAMGFPGLAVDDDRRYALELFDSWCSDMAGPLFTRIREELGLAYFVGATSFLGFNTGLLGFYLGTSPDQLSFAQRELEGQLEAFVEKGIDKTTLLAVQANTAARDALRYQSPKARASFAALNVSLGFAADDFLHQTEHFNAVTPEEIKSLAADLLQPGLASVVTVTPGT